MSDEIEHVITYHSDGPEATALTTEGEWVEYETAEMVARRYATGEISDEELEERMESAVVSTDVTVESAKSATHARRIRQRVEREHPPDPVTKRDLLVGGGAFAMMASTTSAMTLVILPDSETWINAEPLGMLAVLFALGVVVWAVGVYLMYAADEVSAGDLL